MPISWWSKPQSLKQKCRFRPQFDTLEQRETPSATSMTPIMFESTTGSSGSTSNTGSSSTANTSSGGSTTSASVGSNGFGGASATDQAFLQQIYQDLLHRSIDASGANNWGGALSRGAR